MAKCGDCLYFGFCKKYIDPEETFPEVGGCHTFKSKDAFVEVVHGRWEDVCEIKSFKHTNIPVVECSNCEMRFCDIINNHHFMYHYCPNCGARMMDGGNEDV